jgi:hypothetical protein
MFGPYFFGSLHIREVGNIIVVEEEMGEEEEEEEEESVCMLLC